MLEICYHPYFLTAWYMSFMVFYSHIFILLATVVYGYTLLLRLVIGQILNVLVALLIFLSLGKRFQSGCTIIGMGDTSNLVVNTNTYTNPVAFPSIELQILFFTYTFIMFGYYRQEWRLYTTHAAIYHRFLIFGSLWSIVTVSSFFWFHTFFQIIVSIILGTCLGWLWHRFWQYISPINYSMTESSYSILLTNNHQKFYSNKPPEDLEAPESPKKKIQTDEAEPQTEEYLKNLDE